MSKIIEIFFFIKKYKFRRMIFVVVIFNNFDLFTKGQIILKCPFGVVKSPKKPTKFL